MVSLWVEYGQSMGRVWSVYGYSLTISSSSADALITLATTPPWIVYIYSQSMSIISLQSVPVYDYSPFIVSLCL